MRGVKAERHKHGSQDGTGEKRGGKGTAHAFDLLPQTGCLHLHRVTNVLCHRRRQPLLFDIPLGILDGLEGILPLLLQRIDCLHRESDRGVMRKHPQ